MENIESPPIVPTNPLKITGRNILKELNSLDGATKSPKHHLSSDDPKEFLNSSKNLPDVITSVPLDIGKDEVSIQSTPSPVTSSTSLPNTTVTTAKFVECNSTFETSSLNVDVNKTIDNVSAILDETIQILEQLGSNTNVTKNESCNTNEEVSLCSGINILNERFIAAGSPAATSEITNESLTNTLSIDIGSDKQGIVEKQTLDTKHQSTENISQPVESLEQENISLTAQSSSTESNKLNTTVSIVSSVNQFQEIDSKWMQDSKIDSKSSAQKQINSTPFDCQKAEFDLIPLSREPQPCNASEVFQGNNEELAITKNIPVVAQLKESVNVEASTKVKAETYGIHENLIPHQSNFIVKDHPSNVTNVLECGSEILDQKTRNFANIGSDIESRKFVTSKQAEKIREFKTSQTFSVDSLEGQSGPDNCVDSIEQLPTALSNDNTFTKMPTDGMLLSKDLLTQSNASAIPSRSIKQVVGSTDGTGKCIVDMPIKSEVVVKCENDQKSNEFNFKTPMLRYSTSAKMNNQQVAKCDSTEFMVLNSNDFDFLQSRGGGLVDAEDDRRSSLLLRFDPLLKNSSVATPFAPVVQEVEEGAEVDDTLIDSKAIVESATNTSGENSSDEQGFPAADKPFSSNEVAMSVGLVRNTNSMENEAKAFVNNIKAEKAEAKHMQIDSVPIADKKIQFDYADENIRKKMEEYEATQEILKKRLTEKDKTVSKNCAIIEAYEKALAELVVEKEKLTETCELNNAILRQERDIHYQHLMSLETTFSDLHMKYERSKEFTSQLHDRVQNITEEKSKLDELLKQQESRYEKMKEHALCQLEQANAQLEEQNKNNARENARLRAQLKIEEVSKTTLQEQLLQKKKENEELVKICDELIGQKS